MREIAGNYVLTPERPPRSDMLDEPLRTILFIAQQGAISRNLIYALEREFPWIVVKQFSDVAALYMSFTHPVALIAVGASFARAVEEAASEISSRHPQASTAVIAPEGQSIALTLPDILQSRLIRSVLPMDLSLDIWLSVIRLLLRGGEYIPAGMLHSYVKPAGEPAGLPRRTAEQAIRPRANHSDVSELTRRELQILEMVARGLQNKTIAAEFSLSEHTVKIHMHNIISKLGAHNRTEAAARFRDHLAHRTAARASPPAGRG